MITHLCCEENCFLNECYYSLIFGPAAQDYFCLFAAYRFELLLKKPV